MKLKNKIISVAAIAITALGSMPIINDNAVSAVNISERLYDGTSKLYYHKFDDNDDGIYEYISIGYEHAGLQDEYDGLTNYDGLKNVVIPSELDGLPVKKIGTTAFDKCPTLETVVIPESVTYIGGLAFEYCPSLKSVTIENTRCEIYPRSETISNGYVKNGKDTADYYNGVIKGHKGSSAQTYAANYGYKFESIDSTYILGDADQNGVLNVLDAVCIAKALSQRKSYILPECADFNGDNKTNVLDALAIARHLASRKK
ncbi:MAG: leucine-rich repeat protein [Firmicutes bacterium]|nr:leucine-rich repeat protein [Bacillota bacterium]